MKSREVRQMGCKTPCKMAMVIGDDHYNTLGVVRSLGEAGFFVALVLLSEHAVCVTKSRWVSECLIASDKEMVYEAIVDICSRTQGDVGVIPTSDTAALIVSGFLNKLPSNCIAPGVKGDLMALEDKSFAKEIACSCGLDTVSGYVVRSEEEGMRVIADLQFPVIIKPVVSVEGKKADITIAASKEELSLCLKSFFSGGYDRVMVEQYICGQGSHMVEVLGYRCQNGVSSVVGIIEKIREYPLKNGSTSYARVVDAHEGIDLSAVRAFIEKAGFVGIYDMEFKFCCGTAFFIECNFRIGAPSYVMTKLGRNIPALWISGDRGPALVPSERPFMVEQRDVFHVVKKNVSMSEWIKQFRGSSHIFAVKGDMRPIWAYWVNLMATCVRKCLQPGKSGK